MFLSKKLFLFISFLISCFQYIQTADAQALKTETGLWPQVKMEMRPWTRWWWMGNAVDKRNLDRLLTTYQQAGFGGVEVTPIYGAKGFEPRYIDFLSPQWMEMLQFTEQKSASLGMGVDMNTGTGWPFGGPQIKPEHAASKLIIQIYSLPAGKKLEEKIVVKDENQRNADVSLQALTAYSDKSEVMSLLDKVNKEGQLNWVPATGNWQVYAAFTGKTLQKVKRAAPGGEGLVMDHLSKEPVAVYLKRFDDAFKANPPGIRAFFNDSYEVYNASWSPGLFDEFQRMKGYDLRLYLRQLTNDSTSETAARVKSDYREVMGEMLLHHFTINWTNWAHKYNKLTKNQAHGSPGNLLDLYSAVDIPECEMYFGTTHFPIPGLRRDSADIINADPNPTIFKFASSAAHVYGKPLASAETFVWLTEHFKTALSQCKPEVERLFLSGLNHTFYHGTTYSPDDVPFPGWQFYASVNFTPSNSLWSHLSGLNNYITRCQSVLQSGKADNELLVYWPVYDNWNDAKGLDMPLTYHNAERWLHTTKFYQLVNQLEHVGYAQDFVSDKMLGQMKVVNGAIQMNPAGASYKVLIIPLCTYMPLQTLERIKQLAANGATIIFQQMPEDVPGLHDLENRRKDFKDILSHFSMKDAGDGVKRFKDGKGQILLIKDVQKGLELAGIHRELLIDNGIKFIRRHLNDGKYYYLVNHTATAVDSYIPLNARASSIAIMDPQNGTYGKADISTANSKTSIRVQMQPGEALILRLFNNNGPSIKAWTYLGKRGEPMTITGEWLLHFTKGGPEIPGDQKLNDLVSWTKLSDSKGKAFSGTGVYTLDFTLPAKKYKEYLLQLGQVHESAHVWINGKDMGILWSIPFQARVGQYLKEGKNTIKIEVSNLMANHIRDMDQKGIQWRNYHEINFVNIRYKPFDASGWELMPSGLLGPVLLTPVNE